MDLSISETIVAIASPDERASRGVVRMSGALTRKTVEKLFELPAGSRELDDSRPGAYRGWLRLQDLRVDSHLLFWPTAASYTRQPSAEFHMVGSRPILSMVIKAICEAGARLARPGEFTLRAYLAGRLDLTRAEAVLSVIDAEHMQSFQAALHQLSGGLATPFSQLRESLINLLADMEAGLDFVDEDIEFVSRETVESTLDHATKVLEGMRDQIHERTEISDVVRVVLLGHPNVGKSTLFNSLVGKELAVASPIPGTTRDYVSSRIQLQRLTIELVDTAGLDPSLKESDATGIAGRAQEFSDSVSRTADVVIACIDASRPMTAWERSKFMTHSKRMIIAATKMDQADEDWKRDLPASGNLLVPCSATSGWGLERLRGVLVEKIGELNNNSSSWLLGTSARCFESVNGALVALQRARDAHWLGGGDELVAAEMRLALEHIGEIVGSVHNEEILDRLFSRFCIGK